MGAVPSAVWLFLYLELAAPAELGPTIAAQSRTAATDPGPISEWVSSAATTPLINHKGRTWEINPVFLGRNPRERERETGQRRVGLREKDDKNVVCFQNENADKLKHPVLSNTTYLLQGDGCTKLHSLLSKACPILIDFAAEYCWRVIIHLGMICVSILLNPTVVYMFPTLTHESPAQRSSCWRRRITRLQISYIRAGWRERDAGEQRRTVLAVQKAFGNKIKVVALKGKTRTNDIKVGRWGCGWVWFLFTRTFELCLMVRREWVDFNSIDCRFRHQQTHRYALANAAGCLEYRVDPERTVH